MIEWPIASNTNAVIAKIPHTPSAPKRDAQAGRSLSESPRHPPVAPLPHPLRLERLHPGCSFVPRPLPGQVMAVRLPHRPTFSIAF